MRNERLIKLRKERSATQADMARFLGVERTTYGKYETGGIQPPTEIMLRLAEHYDVSVDYLLGNEKKQGGDIYSSGNISGSAVVNGHNNTGSLTVTNGNTDCTRTLSKEEQEILRIYSLLDVKFRLKLMDGILKIEEEFIKSQTQ
jgi:transcriptional regulator with XRE-family HTH domain